MPGSVWWEHIMPMLWGLKGFPKGFYIIQRAEFWPHITLHLDNIRTSFSSYNLPISQLIPGKAFSGSLLQLNEKWGLSPHFSVVASALRNIPVEIRFSPILISFRMMQRASVHWPRPSWYCWILPFAPWYDFYTYFNVCFSMYNCHFIVIAIYHRGFVYKQWHCFPGVLWGFDAIEALVLSGLSACLLTVSWAFGGKSTTSD